MTTARQRRKARSGSSTGGSARSKRSQQKRLQRKPEIKGAAAIRDNWDPKLTVRQNYQRLGLVGDLSMRDSGGSVTTNGTSRQSSRPGAVSVSHEEASAPKRRPGMAIVERDAQGNVVAFHEREEGPQDGAGALDSNADADNTLLASKAEMSSNPTARLMWETLEADAKDDAPVARFCSDAELDWLKSLVSKHGEDVHAMASDRIANVWQKTAGEIRRKIRKAGGFQAMRA